MKVSECCNATWDEDIGICHECKEHSDGVDLDASEQYIRCLVCGKDIQVPNDCDITAQICPDCGDIGKFKVLPFWVM